MKAAFKSAHVMYLLTAAILFTASGPVRAAVILEADFSSAATGSSGFPGWRSRVVESTAEQGDYLSFPSPEVLSTCSGTVEMRIVRGNVRPIETLFTLVDEGGRPLLTAQVFWEGTFIKGSPEINFEGSMSDRVWSSDWSAPRFGRSKVVASTLPLGDPIPTGGALHLAMTWGPGEGDCAFHLNGRTVPIVIPDPFAMSEILMKASRLTVGAEPIPGTEGAYEHLNSPLLRLRTYDEPMNPFVPVIRSVTHDGFGAAGYSGKLVAGDTLHVTLRGDAYQSASFDLGARKGIPLEEDSGSPGTYIGGLTIDWSDGVLDEPVIGHLVSPGGLESVPAASERTVAVDSRVRTTVNLSEELIRADEASNSEIIVTATDANGSPLRDHLLKLTMSTTDEYTGLAGGGTIEDTAGGALDVDWGGVTDSFGEVTAQYVSGFAAKTVLISAKDLMSGDVGVGWIRSFIEGSVDIVVSRPVATDLSVSGTMDVSLSRDWLTADGRSRSRITAVVRGPDGAPVSGHTVRFTLLSDNGFIRVVRDRTDSRGRAYADYIAGTMMGQVQVEVRDLNAGLVSVVAVELRPDAPAEIVLTADPGVVVSGGETVVTARVTDANGNPNDNVDVLYDVTMGEGEVSSASVATDGEGEAAVVFTAGGSSGTVTVRGTVTSREPTPEEIDAALGAVFLYGLEEDPGRLEVAEWLVEPGDKVTAGQDLVVLVDRYDASYKVAAAREGTMSVFTAEERDRVQYGDTLGYVIADPE